jgi:hypothetical protein
MKETALPILQRSYALSGALEGISQCSVLLQDLLHDRCRHSLLPGLGLLLGLGLLNDTTWCSRGSNLGKSLATRAAAERRRKASGGWRCLPTQRWWCLPTQRWWCLPTQKRAWNRAACRLLYTTACFSRGTPVFGWIRDHWGRSRSRALDGECACRSCAPQSLCTGGRSSPRVCSLRHSSYRTAVGVLFLLADKLRVGAALLESIGGAVILPGSTLCLDFRISVTDALAWGSWRLCW